MSKRQRRQAKKARDYLEWMIHRNREADAYELQLKNTARNLVERWDEIPEDWRGWWIDAIQEIVEALEGDGTAWTDKVAAIYYPDGDDLIEPDEVSANTIKYVKENY